MFVMFVFLFSITIWAKSWENLFILYASDQRICSSHDEAHILKRGILWKYRQPMKRLMTKINKMACAPSEDSDQPGHPPSLIRVFTVRMKKAWVLSYPLRTQGRLWAQADISLRWTHKSFCWFCHEVAHIGKIETVHERHPSRYPTTVLLSDAWTQYY